MLASASVTPVTPVVLSLRHVAKHYGGLSVFQDITLTVMKGERLGILGPNGAGKSTLFNLLSGLQPASAGEMLYQGRALRSLKPWAAPAAGIGRTFQIPQAFTGMTVQENLMVGLCNGLKLSLPQARARADETLVLTGLTSVAGQMAGELTLLNLKRLELARAIALRPQLLLLDEIAGGLTESECETLLEILSHVVTPEMTVIWIEHVIHALKSFATRIAVLADKRIVAEGSLETVLLHPDVRAFYFGLEAV